jgi:hypothetical protein
MGAWQRLAMGRHVRDLRDRVDELMPWTNPTVTTRDGRRVMRLTLLPVVSVLAADATGHWRVEVRPEFSGPGFTTARTVDLALPSNRDINSVADQVVAVCVEEWSRTAVAEDASAAMRATAIEQLEALAAHANYRPPASATDRAWTRFPRLLRSSKL